ncbi:putative Ig domain-containing protein [Psychromonas sp. SR45-3]|uniref:putative Ig domain-containing protein n=1 Tax=Psychromonas sp. SR45-3 TaxID=2760930 RepID=UPI0015FB52AA|nr:putative Ig domain-containing protein [Psychromonas sp. SR45-3]MBB1272598.1 putative Ig domain-containing protein [Psychromonas sp. SR45-3]
MNWLKPICLSFFKATHLKHALTKNKKVTPPFSLEALEPKILLSAELVGGMIDGTSFTTEQDDEQFTSQAELDQWTSQFINQVTSNTSSEEPSVANSSPNFALDGLATFFADQQAQSDSDDLGQLLADAAVNASQANDQPLELIIVDPRTPDYLELMEGISTESGSDYLVYMLDAEQDGVQQITDLLATHSDLDAVHVISHGNEGGIQLGSSWLSTDNLDQYSEQIETWQGVFDEDADILIYGCDLAGNLSGELLINSLAELTGADVAASTDATGSSELGGNWELEYQTGEINTQIAFTQDTQGAWQHVLATSGSLWLSTNGNASSDGGGGVNHDILSFSDPSLTLESGDGTTGETDGTFYTEDNTLPANLMAMHYVSADVTVDTYVNGVSGSYNLQVGQIVVSLVSADNGNPDKSVQTVGGGTIDVNNNDLLVYTPSAYTFEFLLKDAFLEPDGNTLSNIHAVSIVESDTTIGDGTTLTAGTYLIARSGTSVQADISTYTDAAGLQKLLSGSEYLSDSDKQVQGLELIESDMVIGGQSVAAGTILVTVNDPVTVGSSGGTSVDVQQVDIVALTVNESEQDSIPNTDVDAQILFDGSDINLQISNDGEINGLSLFSHSLNNIPEATNLTQTVNYIEGTALVALDDIVIFDQDAGDNVTATLTLANTSAGTLTTGTFGTTSSSYNSSTGVWTASGSVSDVNAALAAVSFAPAINSEQTIIITTHIEDAEVSAQTDGIISLNAIAKGNALWFTTKDDVSDSDTTGLSDWTSGQVVGIADPNLTLDPEGAPADTTDGTLSAAIDFDAFNPSSVGGDDQVDINALHYVSVDITIGTDVTFDLKKGDILFSVDDNETLESTNRLDVKKNDLIVFRPNGLNDYSAGEFSILIEGLAAKKLYGVTLVEQQTVVGTTTLNAGDILYTQQKNTSLVFGANVFDNQIFHAVITGTGSSTAGTVEIFIDGDDVGIEEKIYGLELIEKTTVIAGTTLNAGNILITIGDDDDEEVGDNELTVTENDVFILDATSATNASATLLFDGSDLSFSGDINGLTLITNSAPTATNMTSTVSYDEDAISVDLDDIVVTDSNSNEVVSAQLTLVDINAGSLSTGTFGSSTSSYNHASGIWIVSGSVSDVNAALAAVTFTPTANYELNTHIITHIEDSASTGPNDGIINLNVTADNDVPTATNLTQVQNYTEGDTSVALDDIVITELDSNDTVTASLTLANVTAGVLTTGTFGAATSSYISSTGVWSVTGSVSNVNAALAAVVFIPTTDNDVDTSIVSHIEDVAMTGPSDGLIILTVTPQNDDPTLVSSITDQTVTEDSLFNFVFAANTFNDIDTDNNLTYSAQLLGGGVLPSWLTFNASSRTFSGTPLNDDVGTVSVEVIADDGNGGTPATESFDIIVTNSNDDPSLDNDINDQVAIEDSPFTFTFVVNTFSDVDSGDSISYSTQLVGGAALPTWLSFDSNTRTFSGTPSNDDIGTLSIEVIANDGHGGTPATDNFNLVIASSNDLPTGILTITGSAVEDQVLTINTDSLADDDGLGAFSYQWLRDSVAISGATVSTYTLGDADVGTVISYRVSYTDAQGTLENITSESTLAVANINDLPIGSISITGTTTVGNTLTVNNDLLDDDGLGAISYQWQRNGVDIVGATANTYTITVDDDNQTINVVARYSDLNGSAEVVSSEATATVTGTNYMPTGNIVINGLVRQGESLIADTSTLADVDGLGTFSYQWQRNSINIAGANDVSYTLGNDDVDKIMTVVVSYLDNGLPEGTTESVTSTATAAVVNVNDAATATQMNQVQSYTEGDINVALNDIVVSDVDLGDIITANLTLIDPNAGVLTTGVFGAATSSYNAITGEWMVTGTVGDVNAALAATAFTPSSHYDIDTSITTHIEDASSAGPTDGSIALMVTAINDDPTLEYGIPDQFSAEDTVFSFTFAANTFNDLEAGSSLVYSAQLVGGDALPSWLTFNSETRTFSGTPLNDNVGSLDIRVSADDGQGGTTASDSFTLTTNNINDAPVGSVIISGTTAEGDLLSADTSSITDQDGLGVFNYQWLRDGTNISGETSNTFILSEEDIGSKVSVMISFTDARGTNESITSAETAEVININDAPTATNQTQVKSYNEGDSSVAFDNIVVTDVDMGETITATLVLSDITSGSLSTGLFGNSASIYNSVSGIWTVSGSVTDVNDALANVEFLPSTNNDRDVNVTTHIQDALGAGPSDGIINLVVNAVNDDPTLDNLLLDQVAIEDTTFNFTFNENSFNDVDNGASLTYSAQLVGSIPLPTWLNFDASSRTFSGTPLNGDVGVINIEVTADDGQGGIPATASFELVITNTNDDPTLNNAIADQSTIEDSAFNFTLAATTFGDVDNGDSLTYSAQLVGGDALPSWLSFDANTRTFSGTPLNGDVGAINIEVTADDGQGGIPATDRFELVITNTNDDPTLNNAIVNQSATEGNGFNFTFAATTFGDVDSGDSLNYSVQLLSGDILPSWLSFDANTRTFSGTPLNGDIGTINIEVTADDGQGGIPATASFELVISNINNDPTLNNVIADQSATEDVVFNFTLAATTFGDVDSGDSLTYSAELTTGSALPTWLSFDANTRTFTGTPLNSDVGTINIEVTADDGQGGIPATASFELVITNTNDDPTLNNAIADQSAIEDSAFNFTLAANTFGDVDSGDSLTYSAQLTNGLALPSWLSFDTATRTFTGTPLNADVGSITVEVIAGDGNGGSNAVDSFNLLVTNVNDLALGKVVVTGTLSDGEVLVADTSLISDEDGLGEFAFQWLQNGNEIPAATTSTYVLQAGDIGTNISVNVSYIDSQGTLESVNSQPQKVPTIKVDIVDNTEITEERVSVVDAPIFIPLESIESEPDASELEVTLEEGVEEAIQEEIEESTEEDLEGGEPEQIRNLEQNVFQEQQQVINPANTSLEEKNQTSNNINTATVLKTLQKNTIEEQQSQLQSDIDSFLMKDDPLLLIQTNNFISGLNEMRQELDHDIVFNKTTVGSTLAVSAGVSAGYVAWLARSGVLLGSVMGTLPVWRFVDPLPVLNQARGVLGEDSESLESIVADGTEAEQE